MMECCWVSALFMHHAHAAHHRLSPPLHHSTTPALHPSPPMTLSNTIIVGLKEVWSHKFRSLLTMLGIILGVASLVGMAAIIKGMENGMKEAMIAMGGADKVLHGTTGRARRAGTPGRPGARAARWRTPAPWRDSAPLLRLVSPEMEVDDVILTRGDKIERPFRVRRRLAGGARDEPAHAAIWPLLHRPRRGAGQPGVRHRHRHPRRPVRLAGKGSGTRSFRWARSSTSTASPSRSSACSSTTKASRRRRSAKRPRKRGRKQQAGPARARGWGRHGNWAFYRKNQTLYMPLNTAWLRFRAAGDAPAASRTTG